MLIINLTIKTDYIKPKGKYMQTRKGFNNMIKLESLHRILS